MSTIPTSPTPTDQPRPLPSGPAGPRPGGPAGARPAGAAGTHPRGRASARTDLGAVGHRRHLVTAFVQLFLEVEAGCRPPRHLAPLLAPMLYARLTRVWYRGGRPGRVVSVSIIGSGPDAFDAVAVVRRGARCGAVSLRVALGAGGWRVQELARPEDGELPGPAYRVALDEPTADDDAEIPVVLLRQSSPPAAAPPVDGRGSGGGGAAAGWLTPTTGG